jgi:ankyrin repeat protein
MLQIIEYLSPKNLPTLDGLQAILAANPGINLNGPIDPANGINDIPLNLAMGWPEEFALVRCLLEHGAIPTISGAWNKTPLHLAQEVNTIELLKERGALLNAQDDRGKLPLHYAPDVAHARALIGQHGITIDTPFNGNNTLFSHAVLNFQYEFAKSLVTDLGAHITPTIWNNISTYAGNLAITSEFIKFLDEHHVTYDRISINPDKVSFIDQIRESYAPQYRVGSLLMPDEATPAQDASSYRPQHPAGSLLIPIEQDTGVSLIAKNLTLDVNE